MATNYDSLLIKIKSKYYGYLKEAVLNTIKYEATRRAFKKQHEWIQNSYKLLIEKQQLSAEQQESQIKQLKLIIREQKQEVSAIKSECRDRLAAVQTETLLQQKEAEIEQKNSEIARLSQQLENCDRDINHLQSELNKGLHELKLKYRWLIAQFIQERAKKLQSDRQNKSLQTCQNLFKKAQTKLNSLQCENKILRQKNVYLRNNTKMLRV